MNRLLWTLYLVYCCLIFVQMVQIYSQYGGHFYDGLINFTTGHSLLWHLTWEFFRQILVAGGCLTVLDLICNCSN